MTSDDAPMVELVGDDDYSDEVRVSPGWRSVVAAAAMTPPALAVVAILTSFAAMLDMAAVTDFAEVHANNSIAMSALPYLRWANGCRLVVAVVALLIAIAAAARFARSLTADDSAGTAH